ncbi:endonuclease V, partial [candidate division KSB1 bacterium]|nr:endonuclease V [candidate division KSB1 bacterium]
MNLAVDVNYTHHTATAAGILFHEWIDEEPSKQLITQINNVNNYEPGNFYKRELPCILAL